MNETAVRARAEQNFSRGDPTVGEASSRRAFLETLVAGSAAVGLTGLASADEKSAGSSKSNAASEWKPVSDRKIRVGIVGFGFSGFGAAFGFQDHPNVEVVAVSDLFPDRCATLA